jgi:RimJ/RimL family protein N-acetyltransferase
VAELNDILLLQKETIASLPSPEILRENTAEMLSECLAPPHYTVGAWYNGVFVGFSVLYYPHDDAENLSLSLEGVDLTGLKTANNKLCIVREGYRGNALQYHLGKMLEQHAKNSGTNLLCATVSPKNQYSINNMLRLGFRYNRTLMKYGFERNLYYKFI